MGEDISVIILAAGKGERMKSSLPKVMHKVAGRTLISHVVNSIVPLKPKSVTLVIGDGMEQVREKAVSIFPSVSSVIQKERLGTADAVKQAVKGNKEFQSFSGTVIVLYGDTPFIRSETLIKMKETLIEKSLAVVVLGFSPDNPAEYGRLVMNETGNLERIIEYKDADEEQRKITLCNSGVMAIKGDLLPELLSEVKSDNAKNEFYLTDIVGISNSKGFKCGVVEGNEREVMGINSQEERMLAERQAQKDLRGRAIENGVELIEPDTVFLCEDTKIEGGAVIHPYVVFGPGVTIEKHAEIKSFSHIEGASIKSNAVIGPFARIRPGSEIGKDARVGNFVEVKNSKIGKSAKASHLSYIGDSEIGEKTNIGAGVITCNYDGFKKHKTRIGKNVFIGSNSSLVAPLKVGDEAIIGAGSTVVKDIEEGALTVSDNNQKNMTGRAKEYRKEKGGI